MPAPHAGDRSPDGGGDDTSDSGGDGSNGGDSAGGGDDSGENDGSDGPSTTEKVVILVSTAFTLALFAFAMWQVVTAPAADVPRVHVVDEEVTDGGDVIVTVAFRNTQEVGLSSVTVAVDCTDPPSTVQFSHVPAGGRRTGRVVCPARTQQPSASVSSWIER